MHARSAPAVLDLTKLAALTFAFTHCISYGGGGRCLRKAPDLSLEASLPARHLRILLALAALMSPTPGGPPTALVASLWSSEAVEYSSTSKLRCLSRRLLNLGSCNGMTSLSRKARFLGIALERLLSGMPGPNRPSRLNALSLRSRSLGGLSHAAGSHRRARRILRHFWRRRSRCQMPPGSPFSTLSSSSGSVL